MGIPLRPWGQFIDLRFTSLFVILLLTWDRIIRIKLTEIGYMRFCGLERGPGLGDRQMLVGDEVIQRVAVESRFGLKTNSFRFLREVEVLIKFKSGIEILPRCPHHVRSRIEMEIPHLRSWCGWLLGMKHHCLSDWCLVPVRFLLMYSFEDSNQFTVLVGVARMLVSQTSKNLKDLNKFRPSNSSRKA